MELVNFFMGVLFCGLILQGGELLNERSERALRVRVARRRAALLSDEDCAF